MSKLYGKGIAKSLGLVFRHFVDSYLVDLRQLFQRKTSDEKVDFRSSSQTEGLFTIEYPEMKVPVPEAFRYLPFLVVDIDENGQEKQRCTACGTCARVCPPQCIWITRDSDPETGKPVRTPKTFTIDTDMCMNCGLCAEFCPFDAIIMDHEYEIASQDRTEHVMHLEQLSKPASYYAEIKPGQYAEKNKPKEE